MLVGVNHCFQNEPPGKDEPRAVRTNHVRSGRTRCGRDGSPVVRMCQALFSDTFINGEHQVLYPASGNIRTNF